MSSLRTVSRTNPSHPASSKGGGDIPPNQTLYCSNLNDQIHRDDLICCVYEYFCPYGEVIDVVIRKGASNRGQAFVVFSDIASATAALRALRGWSFLGKQMVISYAKTKSDAIMKLEGTYKPRKIVFKKVEMAQDSDFSAAIKPPLGISSNDKIGRFSLCVENLPPHVTKVALDGLFGQYPGHVECRIVEGRGVAFIDFSSEIQAEVAMDGLQNFKISRDHGMKISMAK